MTDEPEFMPRERRVKPKKKDDFGLLLTQLAVCAVALLAALCIKFIGGKVFEETRTKYIELFNDKTTSQEIIQSISKAVNFDMGEKEKPKEKNTSSKTNVSSQVTSSEEDTSSGNENETESGETESTPTAPASSDPKVNGEEEGDAEFIQDYSAVSGNLNNASVMNTMMAPVSGRVTSPYGYRIHPLTGVYSMHSGLDLGADMNTPISAAQSGTVLTVSYSNSYGNYIILQHSGGLQTLYAHCNSISAVKDQEIQRGQTIARVGTTGASTGPHLHFEVRVNGTRINPQWILKKVELV